MQKIPFYKISEKIDPKYSKIYLVFRASYSVRLRLCRIYSIFYFNFKMFFDELKLRSKQLSKNLYKWAHLVKKIT